MKKGALDDGDDKIHLKSLFEVQKILGNGAFGTVISAILKSTNEECAVKVTRYFRF